MSNRDNSFSPHDTWQERFAKKGRMRESAIEGSEPRALGYSREDIGKVKNVREGLLGLVSRAEDRLLSFEVDSDEYRVAAAKEVEVLVEELDGQDWWSTRFTTMLGGGFDDKLESSHLDSVYYLADSGLSMRIKRAAVEEGYGLRKAVQPFMELILFREPGVAEDHFSSVPVEGWNAWDYISPGFEDMFFEDGASGDYKSPIVVHEKGGMPVAVTAPDNVFQHSGNRVVSIETKED